MIIKQCPKCGTQNSSNSMYCLSCNASLKDVVEKEIVYDSNKVIIPEKCPVCGEKIKKGQRTCSNCGEFITKKQIVKNGAYRNSNGYSNDNSLGCLLYFITFLMPYIGIIIGGVYTASDNPEKQELGKQLLIFGVFMIILSVIIWFAFLKNFF